MKRNQSPEADETLEHCQVKRPSAMIPPSTWQAVAAWCCKHGVSLTLEAEPEDVPIKGNCLVSGDANEDRKCEQWIQRQLRTGNQWAWCCAVVTATDLRTGAHANAVLGCCSYKSREDFIDSKFIVDGKPGASYFDEMCLEAVTALCELMNQV